MALPDRPPFDWKQDNRPARNGWAPGGYIGLCRDCGARFIAAKLCRRCADCAYAMPDAPPPPAIFHHPA